MGVYGWKGLYRIADFSFALEADAQLRDLAEVVYSDTRVACSDTSVHFALECREDKFILYRDAAEVAAVGDLSTLFQEVEWALTEAAMAGLGHFFRYMPVSFLLPTEPAS